MMEELINRLKQRRANGWNIIPLTSFYRKSDGSKAFTFIPNYAIYHKERTPENLISETYQNYAVISGKISNLLIIDIDSAEALNRLVETLQISKNALFASTKYLVQTSKGYQLFYSYDEDVKGGIRVADGIDILSDGRLSFALECNEGYIILKNGNPSPLPEIIKTKLMEITNVKAAAKFNEVKAKDYFNDALAPYLEKYLSLAHTPRQLKTYLEKRLLSGISFADAKKKGNRHNLALQVASICKLDPTISLELYHRFCRRFINDVIQPDEDIDLILDYKLDQFEYDEEWSRKYAATDNGDAFINECAPYGFYPFRDAERDKWAVCHILKDASLKVLYFGAFKRFKDFLYQECPNARPLIKELKEIQVESRTQMFDPLSYEIANPFQTNSRGEKIVNTFIPTAAMKMFQQFRSTGAKNKTLPPFISKVICNVYPREDIRELFLHNLAYFLATFQPSQTAFVSLGKTQGTGKGTLYDTILGRFVFGSGFSVKLNTASFTGQFNGELENRLFLHGNDIKEKHSVFNVSTFVNTMKNIIAEPILSIHAKGKERRNIENHLFSVISTNESCPFKLDSSDNRRFIFSPTSTTKLEEILSEEEFLDRDEIIANEIEDFMKYLASIEISATTYRKQIKTEEYFTAVEESRTPQEVIANALRRLDISALEEYSEELAEYVRSNHTEEGLNHPALPVSKLKEFLGAEMSRLVGKELRALGVEKRLVYLGGLKKTGSAWLINKDGDVKENLKPKTSVESNGEEAILKDEITADEIAELINNDEEFKALLRSYLRSKALKPKLETPAVKIAEMPISTIPNGEIPKFEVISG